MSCIVPNCRNGKRSKIENLSFHEFPSDLNVRKLWLEVIEKPNWTPNTTSNSSRICSMHFEESDFALTATKRKRLRPGVVPSIFWDEHGNLIKKVIDSAYMETQEPILKHSRWIPDTNNLPVHESKYPPLLEQHAQMSKTSNNDKKNSNQLREIVVEEEDHDSVAGQNIGLVLSSQHMVQNSDGTSILVLYDENDINTQEMSESVTDHDTYCSRASDIGINASQTNHKVSLNYQPTQGVVIKHYKDSLAVRKWKRKYHSSNRKIHQLQQKLKKYQKLSQDVKANSGLVKQALKISKAAEINPSDAFLFDLINNFEKKKRVFSESTIKHCHSWQSQSPKGYEYPRKNGLLTLPSKNVLQKYIEQISVGTENMETIVPTQME